MNIDKVIADICHNQHGAASRDQLSLAGIDRDTLRSRIRSGEIEEWSSQVLVLHGAPATRLLRVMAAVLDAGPGACASHDTTLALLDVPGFVLSPVHITQPRGGIFRPGRDLVLHTSRRIPPDQVAIVHDIPSVTATRALFDVAGALHPDRLARAIDGAWTRGLTDHRRLTDALATLSKRGRPGIRPMRAAIEARGPRYVAPESGVEGRFHQIVADDGQPPLERQVWWSTDIGDVRFDAFDPVARVDFEVDSALHHRSLTDLDYDRHRDRAVRATGVEVERITDEQVWRHPHEVGARVRAARRRHRRK